MATDRKLTEKLIPHFQAEIEARLNDCVRCGSKPMVAVFPARTANSLGARVIQIRCRKCTNAEDGVLVNLPVHPAVVADKIHHWNTRTAEMTEKEKSEIEKTIDEIIEAGVNKKQIKRKKS